MQALRKKLKMKKEKQLDKDLKKAAEKKASQGIVMNDDERRKLVGTEQSLDMAVETKMPAAIEGLEAFSLRDEPQTKNKEDDEFLDADSFFNLPEESTKKNPSDK